MQQRPDTKSTKHRNEKGSVVPWLVAAVGIVIVGVAILLVAQGSDDEPVTTTPEEIESLAMATLGDKFRSVSNYELGRPPYYFATVEWSDEGDPDAIQATTQELATAFMRQGVYTIGLTVRVYEEAVGFEVIGANGAILHLEDTEIAVEIDWSPVGQKYSPEDFTYAECGACP